MDEFPLLATVADIARSHSIQPDVLQNFDESAPAWNCAIALRERNKWNQVFRVVAGSMPDRKSIWWGALCVMHAFDPLLSNDEREVLTANSSWAMDPTSEWKSLARRFFDTKELRPAIADLNAATIAARSPGNPERSSGKLTAMCVANSVIAAAGAAPSDSAMGPLFFDFAERVRSDELFGRGIAIC